MRIVIGPTQSITEQTKIYDDEGNDVIDILASHGIYLADVVLRITPSGSSLQANVISSKYIVETPNSLMNITQALNTLEHVE